MSLLENVKNQSVAVNRNVSEASEDMIEVAIAYAKHEVSARQIAKALGITPSLAEYKVRHALLSGVRTGKLVYKK
jgi:hypothetical protein